MLRRLWCLSFLTILLFGVGCGGGGGSPGDENDPALSTDAAAEAAEEANPAPVGDE